MYITNDIKGEKRINLSYPIYPTTGRGEAKKEITVVSMLNNNAQYWLQESIETLSKKTGKKIMLKKGEYTDKELNAIIGQKMQLQMNDHDDVLRTSRLYGGTKITLGFNEPIILIISKMGIPATPYLHIM